MKFLGRSAAEREPWRVERVEAALDLMERSLAAADWFVGDRLSIADIALLACTRLAHEGGFHLSARARTRLDRPLRAVPGPHLTSRAAAGAPGPGRIGEWPRAGRICHIAAS